MNAIRTTLIKLHYYNLLFSQAQSHLVASSGIIESQESESIGQTIIASSKSNDPIHSIPLKIIPIHLSLIIMITRNYTRKVPSFISSLSKHE